MLYPPHIKARAGALTILGYSGQRAHAILVDEFADAAPALRTVQVWKEQLQLTASEQDQQAMSANRDIISRAQRLVIDTLEMMEPDPTKLVQLATVAGIFSDKVHQNKQLQRGPDVHQHLTLLIRQAEIDIRAGREPLAIEEDNSETA